jgi:hypothetical protein
MSIQAKFVNSVGVAPGTTTMTLSGSPPQLRPRSYIPYPTVADVRGDNLGVVFPESGGGYMETGRVGRVYDKAGNPYGIAVEQQMPPLSLNWTTSAGMPLPPASGVQLDGLGYVSRDWWQTGRTDGDSTTGKFNYPTNVQPLSGGALGYIAPMERGYFKRTIQTEPGYPNPNPVFTQSPNAPNDEELSRVYGYTPVHSGWMYSQGMSGAAEDAVEIQKKQYKLQVVTTVAITALAALGIWRFMREK